MKKIMFFVLLLFFGLTSAGFAQNTQFTATYPDKVYTGEPFQITFTINASRPEQFTAPSFKGLQLLFGPNQSSSSSVTMINGATTQTSAYSFTYQLVANKEGTYKFEGASIFVNGKKYSTSSITIKALSSKNRPQAQQNQRTQQQAPQPSANISGEQLFIRAIPSKTSVYVGEEILVNYKIFTAINIVQFNFNKAPSYQGFWTVPPTSQIEFHKKREVVNGQQMITAEISKQSLFPQEIGKKIIEPIEITAIAQVQAPRQRSGSIFDIFDDPFFDSYHSVEKNIKSNSISINVKPLPQENRPISFDGLVGKYNLSFKYDAKKQVKANEAIKFYFTVSGRGNIDLVNAPTILFPPDFEVYEPQISTNKQNLGNGVSGTRTFEIIVIPRNPGAYQIPAFEYSYFDPQQAQYVNQTFEGFTLNIETGDQNYQETKKNIINADIEYIKTNLNDLTTYDHNFFLSSNFYFSLGGIFIIFIGLLFVYNKRLKLKNDVVKQKNKKAEKLARKYLKKAEKALKQNDVESFYILISQALWGFLSHKFNIPNALLSTETVRNAMIEKNINQDLISPFIDTIENCEFERFAPQGNRTESMQNLFSQALEIIIKMAKELKK